MVIEKIYGKSNDLPAGASVVKVSFEWFELDRKRIRKTAEDGTELGISSDEPLHDGDILAKDGNTFYVVSLLPADLIRVRIRDIEEMGRACFELGNRHLPIQIKESSVSVPYDDPTYQYLLHKGFDAYAVNENFDGFIVAKAHGHS